MTHVKHWIDANKLTLNVKKTHYIIFARSRKKIQVIPNLKINNVTLNRVYNTKFLGVTLDSNLSWKPHIQCMVQKISKQCGILYLTRNKLNTTSLKLVYQSLIHPIITYCSLAWAGISNDQLKPINIAHKKVIRTISYLRKYDHTNQSFKDLQLLKFYDIIKLRYAICVFKSVNNQNDHNFRSRVNSTYNLRNSSILIPPLMRSSQSQSTELYQGVQVWNSIPEAIRAKPSIASFKKAFKMFLLSSY